MKEQTNVGAMTSAIAPSNVTLKTIGRKSYVVKSVFVGDKDIQTSLLKLAEKKALREMGISCAVL